MKHIIQAKSSELRVRKNWIGQYILQMPVEVEIRDDYHSRMITEWVDADEKFVIAQGATA